jgi:putative nucleotidyltransferase with HDIG domain
VPDISGRKQQEAKVINLKTSIVRQIDSLPSPPATVSRVLEVTANPESCGDDLVNAILPDQAMCTAILKIANSAFFGIPREVATMDKAVNVLGFNEVHNIVLGRAVFTSFKKISATYKRTINEFWRHSFHCGLAAKIIAEKLRCLPSELFIAGLIHDIGKLALLVAQPNDYLSILKMESRTDWLHRLEKERQQFGIDHGEVGLQLLARWMFPEQLLTAVGYHHSPEKCNQHILYAIIVQLSDILSILVVNDKEQSHALYARITTLLPEINRLWERHNLNIDEEQLQEWMIALHDSIEKDSAILHIFTS